MTPRASAVFFGGAKFAIDYYQREYRWETKQVAELIEDLTEKFLESDEQDNDRAAVEHYGHYFLGSIISMTLLLVHLYRRRSHTSARRAADSVAGYGELAGGDAVPVV